MRKVYQSLRGRGASYGVRRRLWRMVPQRVFWNQYWGNQRSKVEGLFRPMVLPGLLGRIQRKNHLQDRRHESREMP
jgi:hypothetical protein